MKKKLRFVLLTVIILATLCSCGETSQSEPESNINYKAVQQDMGNFMSEKAYTVHDGWIYKMSFPEDGGRGLLGKIRTDGSEYSVLTSKGAPTFINVEGEFIYSILQNEDTCSIYRCRLGGDDVKQLIKSNASSLQLVDDYIYYHKLDYNTGKTLGYYRCLKDGTEEELIIDKEIYYGYVVDNDIYYQDDDDSETIHIYNMETQEDVKLTDGFSYGFISDGKFVYYLKNDKSVTKGDLKGTIVKIDIETKEETVIYEGARTSDLVTKGNNLYFINANDDNRIYSIGKDGEGIKLISQDTNCGRLAIYGEQLIYTDFDSDFEYIDHIYICNLDGSDKIVISE